MDNHNVHGNSENSVCTGLGCAATDLGGVHDDGGDKVEEDVVAVSAHIIVAEGYLQLIHGLQEKTLTLVL